MAKRGATIIGLQDFSTTANIIKAKVMASTQVMSALRKLAEKKRQAIELDATMHYQSAINAIDDILTDGHAGAAAPVSRIYADSPTGVSLPVAVKWNSLSSKWLKNKAFRSKPGYAPKRMRNGTRAERPRGRSFGAHAFWLDERKLSHAFKQQVVGRGKANATYRMKEIKGGDFELVFDVRFDKLPARYLDRAIRRALIKGAGELGNASVLGSDFSTSDLTQTSHPRGLARGGWAEALRPTMAPISRRLGRAMKEQILRSIARS